MPATKHEAFFRRHPVFTGEDLSAHLSSKGEVGTRTQESLVSYHTKAERLVRVRRGLFAVIPPGETCDTYPVDPYLVAAKLTGDAVLSHHTALEFHGRAYSVWQHVSYMSSRPLKTLAFRSHVFRGTKFPEALLRAGKEHFDVLTRERAGMSIKVASLERTLVDVLDRPHFSGGWEEVWRSLESVELFDLDRVVEYTLLLDNATTASKVGVFLEQHRGELMVDERYIQALRERRPKRPHYLDRNRRVSGILMSDWNLIVPVEVAERSWSEVI